MKRRRKKRQVPKLQALRNHARRRQKNKCFWCGEEMNGIDNDPLQCTADHHPIPRYAGGKNQPGNIVAACRKCNNGRNPETNRRKKDAPMITSGEIATGSPFDILKKMPGIARQVGRS